MKGRLNAYLHGLFVGAERKAPANQRLAELKEELLRNTEEKYDDLIAQGYSPEAAYNAVIAGVGDITDLIDSVAGKASPRETADPPPFTGTPLTLEEREVLRKKQERKALLRSIAVAMYILCWVPLVVLSTLMGDFGSTIGLTVMFLMIAGATAMTIYGNMTGTKAAENAKACRDDDDDDSDDDDDDEKRSPVYKAISGALWMLTVVAYVAVSNWTGAWHLTWLMFLMATALDNVIKAIFDMRR